MVAELQEIVEQYPVVFFDIETNGFETDTAIFEIAALKYMPGTLLGSGVGEEFHSLIYFDGTPNLAALAVNNISLFDLKNSGKPMSSVLRDFADFAHDSALIGHNIVNFDLRIMNHHCATYEVVLSHSHTIDTLRLAQRLLRLPSYSLSFLSNYFNIKSRPTHRALADVEATVEVFKSLIQQKAYK